MMHRIEPPDRLHRGPLLPEVSARCTGCGRCVAICPPHVLWLETIYGKKSALLHDAAGCSGCSRCAVVCPFDAIHMRRRPLAVTG